VGPTERPNVGTGSKKKSAKEIARKIIPS